MEKYQKTLEQFNPAPSDSEVTRIVNDIVDKNIEKYRTQSIRQFLYGCIDLTSLNANDSRESIWKFVEKVNTFDDNRPDTANVAAICVYPNFVSAVSEALTTENTKIAAVSGGFPSSQTFIEVKVAETALAIADGADEIDIVINLGYYFDSDYQALCEEILELKDVCKDKTLKVILETGMLKTAQHIKNASILSIYSGADFIKSSTGKNSEGATLEAIYVMCETIKEYYTLHNKKIGIKVSGGVRTTEEAIKYYCIVKETLGDEWLTPDLFRIGASSLADDLLND